MIDLVDRNLEKNLVSKKSCRNSRFRKQYNLEVIKKLENRTSEDKQFEAIIKHTKVSNKLIGPKSIYVMHQ